MFRRILIANRGEIAVRIFRACREMNIQPVVVYSQGDADALHVQLAEEAFGVTIEDEALPQMKTVGDLVNYLESHQG